MQRQTDEWDPFRANHFNASSFFLSLMGFSPLNQSPPLLLSSLVLQREVRKDGGHFHGNHFCPAARYISYLSKHIKRLSVSMVVKRELHSLPYLPIYSCHLPNSRPVKDLPFLNDCKFSKFKFIQIWITL